MFKNNAKELKNLKKIMAEFWKKELPYLSIKKKCCKKKSGNARAYIHTFIRTQRKHTNK